MTENESTKPLPDGTHLAYIVSHEAWYARTPGVIDGRSVTVAASAEGSGGGVAWEFVVDDHEFSRSETAIEVGVFGDSFVAFAQIPEFFAALAERKVTDLTGVITVLEGMGAIDETDRTGPAGMRDTSARGRVYASLDGLVPQDVRAHAADRVMQALGAEPEPRR